MAARKRPRPTAASGRTGGRFPVVDLLHQALADATAERLTIELDATTRAEISEILEARRASPNVWELAKIQSVELDEFRAAKLECQRGKGRPAARAIRFAKRLGALRERGRPTVPRRELLEFYVSTTTEDTTIAWIDDEALRAGLPGSEHVHRKQRAVLTPRAALLSSMERFRIKSPKETRDKLLKALREAERRCDRTSDPKERKRLRTLIAACKLPPRADPKTH